MSSNEAFAKLRERLMDRLFLRPETLKRVARSALHSSLYAHLVISCAECIAGAESESLLTDLSDFVGALDQYQQRNDAQTSSILTKHAVLHVKKTTLRLRRLVVTACVVKSTKALMETRIPVVLSSLNLDFRFVSCNEAELTTFIQTITMQAADLMIDTGKIEFSANEAEGAHVAADSQGQDFRDRIRMVMKAIGGISRPLGLSMSGLLCLCMTPLNREAVWRGLFEDVLSGDVSLELLSFDEVELTDEDEAFIAECVARWHEANAARSLRVKRLRLHLLDCPAGSFRALLSALDDMEKLSLQFLETPAFLGSEDLARFLRCPSLRSLSLVNTGFPTLDAFDRSVSDRFIPVKPRLRELILHGFMLGNESSFPRFLRQLNPLWGEAPSELSTTLRVLHVVQANGSFAITRCFDCGDISLVEAALSTNRTLRDVAINVIKTDLEAVAAANQLCRKHNGCVLPVANYRKHFAMAKAQKVAFLSTLRIHQAGGNAAAQLDADILRQIFAFCAPYSVREVRVKKRNPVIW